MLARWQSSIVDDEGNVLPAAQVTVRRETAGGALALLYSDRDGLVPMGNPFPADSDGFAFFHVAGGAYRIDVSAAGFSRTLRYVGVGTMAERDLVEVFTPRGEWASGTTYAQNDLVSYFGFAFVSNSDSNLGNAPTVFGSPVDAAGSDTNWTHVGTMGTAGADGDPGADGADGSSFVTGTSSSSVAIGTGSKSFTVVESGRGWDVGARLRVSETANPAVNFMEGVVTSYSGNALQLLVDLVEGSGTISAWTINLAGEQGTQGVQGDTGPQGIPSPTIVPMLVFLANENVTVGTVANSIFWTVPTELGGYSLVELDAAVFAAGTTGNLDIIVRNVTKGVSMLTTPARIESGETSTLTSSQPGVISQDGDYVDAGDVIVIDVDSVQTSPPMGLNVNLKFENLGSNG